MRVQTFNFVILEKLIKASDKSLQQYIRCLKESTISWKDIHNKGMVKLREQAESITKLQSDNAELVKVMEKLARLGNEPNYGNSIGNEVAQSALMSIRTENLFVGASFDSGVFTEQFTISLNSDDYSRSTIQDKYNLSFKDFDGLSLIIGLAVENYLKLKLSRI